MVNLGLTNPVEYMRRGHSSGGTAEARRYISHSLLFSSSRYFKRVTLVYLSYAQMIFKNAMMNIRGKLRDTLAKAWCYKLRRFLVLLKNVNSFFFIKARD